MNIQTTSKKPTQVVLAIQLLWASLIAGLTRALLDPITSAALSTSKNPGLIIGIAFLIILFLKISAGRNWARIIFLFIFVISVISVLSRLSGGLVELSIDGLLYILILCLQSFAVFLLFTKPGNTWFSRS